jgi:two-component system response regulator YesN
MKILIVDDDFLVRVALKTLIIWEDYGYHIVGEASDGRQALEMVKELKPDIVLLDIQMPVMDGLETLRQMKSLEHRPETIVLSSYDEFNLVKQALQLGAADYIRKLDINPESIIETLKTVSNKVKENKELSFQGNQYGKNTKEHMKLIRKNLLQNIIGNFYYDERKISEECSNLGIHLDRDYNYCFVIHAYEFIFSKEMNAENMMTMKFALINIVEEIITGKVQSFCLEYFNGQFIVISIPIVIEEKLQEEDLSAYGNQLVFTLKEYLNLNVEIGIGEGGKGIKGIQEAYQNAQDAFSKGAMKTDSKIYLSGRETEVTHENRERFSPFFYKESLFTALDEKSEQGITYCIQQIYRELKHIKSDKKEIYDHLLKVFYMISDYFEPFQIATEGILVHSFMGYQEIIRINSLQDVKMLLNQIKDDLCDYCKKNKDINSNNTVLETAVKYMESHFNEEISLGDVAEQVNLNPSYLSHLLKKEYGKGYSEYLIDLRIEKAKVLITTTDYKIYEIGQLVGYSNMFYFTRIFKRKTGLTPSDYKMKSLEHK